MIPDIPGTRIRFVNPGTRNHISNQRAKNSLKLGQEYQVCWIDDSLSCRMIYLIGLIGVAFDCNHFEVIDV